MLFAEICIGSSTL